MTLLLDSYSRRARLVPTLLVLLPLGLVAIAWIPEGHLVWGAALSLIATAGGATLAAELSRDRGKAREQELFDGWGGCPTTRLLRHREASKVVVLDQLHSRIGKLTGVQLPSPSEEAADPGAADQAYEACARALRGRTRDQRQFPLVFAENCSYGFRRNLWGLKPFGLVTSIAGLSVIGLSPGLHSVPPEPAALLAGISCTGLAAVWLFAVTPRWVRTPAEAYAQRLLEAADRLA